MKKNQGFTLIEILTILIVIGLLASVSFVAYKGIQARAGSNAVKADLLTAAKQIDLVKLSTKDYPSDLSDIRTGSGTTYTYENNSIDDSYCLTGSNVYAEYYVSSTQPIPTEGACPEGSIYLTSTIITIDDIKSTNVTLSWPAVSDTSGYTVDRALNDTFTTGFASITTSNTSVIVTGLTPDTEYFFRVMPNKESGTWSSTANATTLLPTVNGFSLTVDSSTAITASWSATAGASSYSIEYGTDSGLAGATQITGVATTSRQITGLTAGTIYYVRVQPIIGGMGGTWSDIENETTTIGPPSNLAATQNTTTKITASWTAYAGAAGYVVEADTSASFTTPISATSGTITATSYQFTGLATNTTYYFRVKTVGGTLISAWTTSVSQQTTVANPTSNAYLASYRTAGWSGSCPTDYTSRTFSWNVTRVDNLTIGSGSSSNPGTADLTAYVWGSGNIYLKVSCVGPWSGTLTSVDKYYFGNLCDSASEQASASCNY